MSTFNGLVKEFPNIRIDYFRHHPDKPRPAALFLSHVHSDHLLGLESVKMPFVYCSATTRRILLKMEKYPHRINFAKGILEARKQHYRHLKTVLRAIPMSTATVIELGPKSTIQVTMLDANHCPGAVMFLIQGDAKAIVYTGDIRAEPWWVNSIVQNPVLFPFTCGLKRLDCIYLDTTFATHEEPYREFPSQAEGLKELLERVNQCSPDTVFYFRAWTLGYENVWIALSTYLQSRVHVNRYQLRIFQDEDGDENSALTGFTVGNSRHPGCLTLDSTARIHSCEPGLSCHSEIKKNKNVVWISPIISRLDDGTEIRELGAGGGWRDLYPTAQVKLEDTATLEQLLNLSASLADEEATQSKFDDWRGRFGRTQDLALALESPDEIKVEEDGAIKLEDFVTLLSRRLKQTNPSIQHDASSNGQPKSQGFSGDTIHFPYSRHSSYNELRHLVSRLQPKDICPCAVSLETWSEEVSMRALFGDLCAEQIFHFDQETRAQVTEFEDRTGLRNSGGGKRKREDDEETQTTASQNIDPSSPVVFTSPLKVIAPEDAQLASRAFQGENTEFSTGDKPDEGPAESHQYGGGLDLEALYDEYDHQLLSSSAFDSQPEEHMDGGDDGAAIDTSREGRVEHGDSRKQARIEAYNAARLALFRRDSTEWDAMPLRSTGHAGHNEVEPEL